MRHIQLGCDPIAHGAGSLGGIDLILVEFTEVSYLFPSEASNDCFSGQDPLL